MNSLSNGCVLFWGACDLFWGARMQILTSFTAVYMLWPLLCSHIKPVVIRTDPLYIYIYIYTLFVSAVSTTTVSAVSTTIVLTLHSIYHSNLLIKDRGPISFTSTPDRWRGVEPILMGLDSAMWIYIYMYIYIYNVELNVIVTNESLAHNSE